MYATMTRSLFPLAGRYPCPTRIGRGSEVRERAGAPSDFLYSERHLQCLWFDGALRPATLSTRDGERVVVESPGRWNLEAGPDFLDAVLRIGPEARRVQGDIEIHVRPTDWSRHAHGADPRYRHVVAHVTYFPDRAPISDLPPHMTRIPLMAALSANPAFSFDAIDIAAYPFREPHQLPAPCAVRLASLPVDAVGAFLDGAGQERLRRKTERMQQRLERQAPEELFYDETMAALGYKQNVAPFRALARLAPPRRLQACQSAAEAYAILLGVAGLMPTQARATWPPESREFVRSLWDLWWPHQDEWSDRRLGPSDWVQSGLRPQNAPRRRLAAAASLFQAPESPFTTLCRVERSDSAGWHHHTTSILADHNRLPFMAHHLSFGSPASSKPLRILGDTRTAAIVTNVVIPLLAATDIPVAPLIARLPPEHDNVTIRRCAHLLLGRDHNPALYHGDGLRQQGLIQIFQDFCLSSRAICESCDLCSALDEYETVTR